MRERKQRQQRAAKADSTSATPSAAVPGWRRWPALGLTATAVLALGGVVATAWLGNTPETASAAAAPAVTPEVSGVHFDGTTYTNRLIESHDPYLLLHAHNPVDWYPWGPAALAAAKRQNKPIFLSVGYSTCYWCHVAEREIYSKPEIAKQMNQWFINIKVDREQRPDVDRVYMLATQVMTGHGGWPNNLFLTPDLKPFFAGSYFPPADQGGRPGFPSILARMHRSWNDDHANVARVSAQVYQALQKAEQGITASSGPVQPEQWLQQAVHQAAGQYNQTERGFSGGGSTMFPQEPVLGMLLASVERHPDKSAQDMVTATLTAMAEGGVLDQLAGGFHRYSTDAQWNVPHFEKMLYDNAQLLDLYAHAYAVTKQPLFKQVALQTAHYLTAEMQAPQGGFYSAQDSQIDGVEGSSYVWTQAQVGSVLGAAGARRFLALYALTPMPPSFGGQKQSPGSVLRLDRTHADGLAEKQQLAARLQALAPLRDKLLAARSQRPQPATDEKIVTASNALAILGFARAGQALGDPGLTRTAVTTATWEWAHAFDPKTGALRHQFYRGTAGGDGFLDDYALLGQAFLALHDATGDASWRDHAAMLADAMLKRFGRPDGQLASTGDASDLLVAPPEEGDSVQPSGQSAAMALLLGLAADGGDARYATAARRALAPLGGQIEAQPYGWASMVATLSQPSYVALLQQPEKVNPPAVGLPGSADYVQAHARRDAKGGLQVEIHVNDGYHINANPASDPYLIPTRLLLDSKTVQGVTYPPSHLFKPPFASAGIAVYSGQVVLHATLPAGAGASSNVAVQVQACNDKYCLAPSMLALPLVSAP